MIKDKEENWYKILLFNFILVALLGALMRYKIAFELPFIDQKNLQNAHSHFAFAGWVTQALMFFILDIFKKNLTTSQQKSYQNIMVFNLFICYAMIISFLFTGYGIYSIALSVLQMIIMLYYFYKSKIDLKKYGSSALNWILASYFFYIISAAGTFYLAYMAISKVMPQDQYLASIYWYLHFQYNGWFFFACVGILLNQLMIKYEITLNPNYFNFLFISCIITYGLSVLWYNLNPLLYVLIVFGAILQTVGFFGLLKQINIKRWIYKEQLKISLFILFILSALIVKILLQLFSVIPAVSKWAFGYRPVVIAYLHLILLVIISSFLLLLLIKKMRLIHQKRIQNIMMVFLSFIFLNEVVLALQGILSFQYIIIPKANELLFIIALGLLATATYLWFVTVVMMKNLK